MQGRKFAFVINGLIVLFSHSAIMFMVCKDVSGCAARMNMRLQGACAVRVLWWSLEKRVKRLGRTSRVFLLNLLVTTVLKIVLQVWLKISIAFS